MTVALPIPYEDELLYSVIARYMSRTSVEKPTVVIRNIFGRFIHPTADMFCGLEELVRQTYDSWGMSGQEIVNKHTVLPYFTSYATRSRRIAAYSAILGNGSCSPYGFLGLASTRVSVPSKFRFCEQCAIEDVATFGETYWRRSFHLPGVTLCLKHKLTLCISNIPTRRARVSEWRDCQEYAETELHNCTSTPFPWENNPHILNVMRQSVELLATENTRYDPSITDRYRRLAQDAGLSRPSGMIDSEAVLRGMNSLYDEDYLNSVGLPFLDSQSMPWPIAMMLRARSAFQPLQHLLLNQFLELLIAKSPLDSQAHLVAQNTFICPNNYAKHGPEHVIEIIKVKGTADGRLGYGSCSCGLKFMFCRCLPHSSIPEIKRVEDFGADWREVAQAMRRRGESRSNIAKVMGLTIANIKSLLNSREHKNSTISDEKIHQWREEWRLLLDSVYPGGHIEARRHNGNLYYLLNRHDKDWLRESAKKFIRARNSKVRGSSVVDWESRDELWSNDLRMAAERLYADVTVLQRASRTAILSEAGIAKLKSDRLPLCHSVLEECTESIEHYQIRRLEYSAKTLIQEGKTLDDWRLLGKARIPKKRVTAALREAIIRLTSISK